MKLFIVTLTLITVIVGVLIYFMPRDLTRYATDISASGTVSIYCRSTELKDNAENRQIVDMGCGKMVLCSVSELDETLSKCRYVDGLSVRFSGDERDVERIINLFNLQVNSTLCLDGLYVICGNSARLRGGVIVDGCIVNVQIAYKDGVVTVGSPLILGDY